MHKDHLTIKKQAVNIKSGSPLIDGVGRGERASERVSERAARGHPYRECFSFYCDDRVGWQAAGSQLIRVV